jgi:RND family efflux transporter MFP subunit
MAWARYRALALWLQIAVAIVVVLVLFGLLKLTGGSSVPADAVVLPTVTTERVDALAGAANSVAVIGSVRSVTEASVFAQSGGTVTALHADQGSYVGAGYLIAELENASQRAAVLQAEGAYEAATAARSGASPSDIKASALNTFMTAYSSVDILLKSNIDTFFGVAGGIGPQFLISPSPFDSSYFPKKRQALADSMTAWREELTSAGTQDPQTILDAADAVVKQATALANDLSQAATKNNSDATAAQLTALVAARSGLTTVQAAVTASKLAYQGQNTSATAGADASVKIALGSLNAAKAQLEKTFVRAPVSGTINFLPLHVGDYIVSMSHVATVAQNGALEIVAYISEESRALLSVSTKVTVEDSYPAVITSIAPALDPVTKQIEIHLALTSATSTLVNGQSVRINLPSTSATSPVAGPLLLPLTALKLTPSARVVFTPEVQTKNGVEATYLVALPVEIGDVHGDRIEITTPLRPDIEIVTDARGLSDGEKVTVATTL